jgi:hypothetical protein
MPLSKEQEFLNLAFYVCYNAGVMGPDETWERHNLTAKESDKLALLQKGATSILLKCRTMFPFDLFPNTLIIDHNKVDIIYRNFFRISHTVSIHIAHINYVAVDSAFFLSTLRIDVKGMEQDPPPLIFLKTREAHLAKNLIFGLISVHADHIDLSHLPRHEVIHKLVEIGTSVVKTTD